MTEKIPLEFFNSAYGGMNNMKQELRACLEAIIELVDGGCTNDNMQALIVIFINLRLSIDQAFGKLLEIQAAEYPEMGS